MFSDTVVHFLSFFYCSKTSTCFQDTNNVMTDRDIRSKCIRKCHIKASSPHLFSTYLEINVVLSVSARKSHFMYIFSKTIPTITLLPSNPYFAITTYVPWPLLTTRTCPPWPFSTYPLMSEVQSTTFISHV